MTASQHRLRVGDLIFSEGSGSLVSDRGYTIAVYGDGFERGKVVSIDVAIRTALQDGGRVFTESHGMREFVFFAVVGGDSVARAHAEEDIAAVCGIRTEIGWVGPDGFAAESVWDVETSDMPELVEDDLMEVQRDEVVYALRFTCQPFCRPNELDIVPALEVESGVTPETLTIDAGTATTRWTARIGVLSDEGSFLRISGSRTPRAVWTGAAPFDTSGHHYVSLDYDYDYAENKAGVPVPYLLVGGVGGVYASLVALTTSPSFGRRATFLVEADSVAVLEFGIEVNLKRFDFTNLAASNVQPFEGSTMQTSRSFDVRGSARAQGVVSIAAPSGESLGTVLLYTSTSEAAVGAPSMRRNRVSGGTPITTPTGEMVSGAREVMTSDVVFDIPVAELTRGLHQLVGRFYVVSAGTYTMTYTAQARIGGTNVGAIESGYATIAGASTEFVTADLGNVHLPPSALPDNSSAVVRVTFSCASANLTFDEGWHFNVQPRVGELTWVEVGDHRRLWIESPNVDRPEKAIFVGDLADKSDAFHLGDLIESWGDHEFFKTTSAFIVTSGTDAAASEFAYHRRYVNTVLEDDLSSVSNLPGDA